MTSDARGLTNVEIVVLALGRRGGATKKVSSEDIAAEAHQLAPDKFSWQLPEYRERGWPDKYIVKTALEDAKKEEYGSLVEGGYANDTSRDGWALTNRGAEWLAEKGEAIAARLQATTGGLPPLPRKERQRFIRQIRQNPLFVLEKAGNFEAATDYQFTDMLNCSPDAPRDVISAKFKRLQGIAVVAGDPEVAAFLKVCGSRFAALLAPLNTLQR